MPAHILPTLFGQSHRPVVSQNVGRTPRGRLRSYFNGPVNFLTSQQMLLLTTPSVVFVLLLLLLLFGCYCCRRRLLTHTFFPRHFPSLTNGDPHISGSQFQPAALSILCVMFQLQLFFVLNLLNVTPLWLQKCSLNLS